MLRTTPQLVDELQSAVADIGAVLGYAWDGARDGVAGEHGEMRINDLEGPGVRVMTMNVFSPANPDWAPRHRLVADAIRDLAPDVVALQEVPIESEEVLRGLLGDGYHLSHFARPSGDGVAGTLATRWPTG